MTLEEFIENHIRVAPKGEHIKLTPVQYAFLDWNKKYKKKTSDMETLKNGDIVSITSKFKIKKVISLPEERVKTLNTDTLVKLKAIDSDITLILPDNMVSIVKDE